MARLASLLLCSGPILWGCGSDVDGLDPGEPNPYAEPTACEGRLGQDARELARVASGQLLTDGEWLIHTATHFGEVQRIDRCTGAVETLSTVSAIGSAALRNGHVYFVERISETQGQLLRVPVAGGATEVVAPVPEDAHLVAHSEGIYFVDSGLEAEDYDAAIFQIDEAAGEPVVRQPLDSWDGVKQFSLIGVSDAGLYYKASYDCGCNPGLTLLPFDGGEAAGVDSSAGAWSVAPVGEDLFAAVDLEPAGFGEMILDIVRMPLEGGDPEVLVPASEEETYDVRTVAANDRLVCWASYGAAPRCLRREPADAPRALAQDDWEYASETVGNLVVVGDVAYWTRVSSDSGQVGIWAAVP